ncbi:MAG: hypothetical protein ACYC7D_07140 [Nitrososphaerales archaeon]
MLSLPLSFVIVHAFLIPYLDVKTLFNGYIVGMLAFLFVIVTILIFIFIYDNLRREKRITATSTT